MPKDLRIDEYILQILNEGPLSIKMIKDTAIADESFTAPKKDESYYEALNRLFIDNKIQIRGYNVPEGKRLQRIFVENLIIGLVKTDQLEIFNLIKQLDTDSYEEALEELKDYFIQKVSEIEDFNQQNWDELVDNVVVKDPRIDNLLILEGENEIDAFLISHYHLVPDDKLPKGICEKIKDYKDRLPLIQEKYDAVKVYYLKNPLNAKEVDSSIEWILDRPIGEDEWGIDRCLNDEQEYDDLYYESKLSMDGEVDINHYLKLLGYKKPVKMIYEEIDNLFNDVLFYKDTHESSDVVKRKLSRALSESIDSTELLDQIICEATGKKLLTHKY